MLNFDYITLDLFLKENKDFFLGARLQKIQQPTRQELVFTMRNLGETRKFYININPRFFHICFVNCGSRSEPVSACVKQDEQGELNDGDVGTQAEPSTTGASLTNEQKRFLQIPKQPHMFCMLLRKYLEASKIAKVEQPKGERILEFYFETYDETGEKIYLCLAIELMGKHSNVVLYNYDTNMIIGCAHNVGSDKSRERELIGGLPYVYPPKHSNKITKGFSNMFRDSSSPLEGEGRVGGLSYINTLIDNYFADFQLQEKTKSLRSKFLTQIGTKIKKVKTALEKVKKQGVNEEKSHKYRKYGDLIMANLFNNKDFSPSIEIMDYETNLPLKIELDETKTLKENANRFYKLYNKAKTANAKSLDIINDLEIEKKYLEQVLYSIEEAENIYDLFEIEEEITETKCKVQSAKSSPSTIQPLSLSTFKVYIGKNNKQNDYIVSKLARDNDIWFHTHNCAGSHVLLRVEAGQTITDEIIFECAKLAKQYSSAKLSSKVGVIYTAAKNLKKPPKAALGYVIYKGEKEIIVN